MVMSVKVATFAASNVETAVKEEPPPSRRGRRTATSDAQETVRPQSRTVRHEREARRKT